jgi:hypothetical protein
VSCRVKNVVYLARDDGDFGRFSAVAVARAGARHYFMYISHMMMMVMLRQGIS